MLRPAVELYIGGKRFQFWSSISVSRTISAIASMNITIPNPGGILTTRWVAGTPVELKLGMDTNTPPLFMKGTIEPISFSLSKSGSELNLNNIRDPTLIWEKELCANDDLTAYSDFSGTNLQAIQNINSLISDPLTLAAQSSTVDIGAVFTFDRTKKTITVINTHIENGGYEWFYNPGGNNVIIRSPQALTRVNVVRNFVLADVNQSPGKPDVSTALLVSDSVEEDPSDIYNRVLGIGTDSEQLVEDIASQNNYGIRETIETYDNISGSAAIRAAAQEFLDNHAFPRISLTIETYGQPNLNVGDIVYIDDIRYGTVRIPTKIHRIIEITDDIGQDGWKTTIQLANFRPRLTDFL